MRPCPFFGTDPSDATKFVGLEVTLAISKHKPTLGNMSGNAGYDAMKLEDLITEAFAARPRPEQVVVVGHPETNEYLEALQFRDYDWRVTTCDLWSKFSDAIYGFCPQAFCYYLPGMLRSQLVEDRPDLLINSSVIAMLDRSDSVEYWDSFFIERWPLLTRQECLAVQEWVLWLSFKQTGIFSESSLTRAYETLEILASPAR